MTDEEIPISKLWTLRNLLAEAVDDSQWEEVISIVKQLLVVLRDALDPGKCKTGTPHLDGLYMLGTMDYERAPAKARRALNKMNRIIKTAKMNLPKKGK